MSRPPATEAELREARGAAVAADFEAQDLERRARKARRKATAAAKHYEELLLTKQGPTLPTR